jgi:polyphosphate kinase
MASASPSVSDESSAAVRRYSDREQSWLAFNRRVLELAQDPAQPLLERAKFCAIYASNLDEFFMVRVAGLKRRISAGIAVSNASGDAPRDVYAAILTEAREQMREHAITYRDEIAPVLAEEGIEVVRWRALTDDERKRMEQLFIDQVFPVLTPLAVDPAHPFPYISGLSLNLAVVVRNPETRGEHFARVKVPQLLPRFYRVNEQRFVPLEDVIAAHLDQLFPGMQVLSHYTFRVTRNEDVSVEEDDAENLLHAMETELTRRRFGPPVRLEIGEDMDPHVLDLLIRELGVHESEVFALPEPLDLTGLWALHGLDRDDLKDPPFVPRTSIDLSEVETSEVPDIFAVARDRDVLLHHPYESFSTSVQAFLDQAARDPDVLAIKQTLYRTSADSPIVDALIDAADAGKQVLALVEIKARFDEQANIRRARKLEEAGCHVVYGVVGLKTHCKASLVVRREGDTIRRYTHIGTGNYHPKTARLYEDLGLITADPMVADDVTHLFNVLSGYSRHTEYGRLLVAPHSIRDGLIQRIEAEVDHHRAGRPAGIRFKVNSIVDERTMDALYAAADAGVPVEVWVRGICGLRAGVPGLSESNLRVRSILGRFLEHSRIYWFASGGHPQVWIGSADLMHRNLDRRVEALVSIADPEQVQRLTQLLDLGLSDEVDAWHLQPDDTWQRVATTASGERLTDIQAVLLQNRGWAP